jgi:peroxiredoxin Q/BCP
MRRLAWLPLVALLAAGLAFAEDTDDDGRLAVGDRAPDFRLNDDRGRAVRLADANEASWVVLAFYPKASTPGCTREVCSLRDVLQDLEDLDARVFGLSLDDVVSQRAFREQQLLTFPLLSDPDGSVAAKYEVLASGLYAQRVTFLVDPEGVVRHIDRAVDVMTHGADVAARLRALQAE